MKFSLFVFMFMWVVCFSALGVYDEGTWSDQGELALQYRYFENDLVDSTEDIGMAIFARMERKFEGEYSDHVFRGFARIDEKDGDRNLIKLEDAYFSWRLGEDQSFHILTGYKVFNWTATEAFHPADMVNSRNYDSDLENLEKVGELTIELKKEFSLGTFSVFLWPKFEDPIFPGDRSRLGSGVDLKAAQVVVGDEIKDDRVMQYGTRLTLALDSMDLSFHYIRQIDRFFPLVGTDNFTFLFGQPIPYTTDLNELAIPHYFMKDQYGLTAQVPWEGFSFKLEGAYRDFDSDKVIYTTRGLRSPSDHTDVAFGIDYTMTFDSSDIEVLWLAEMSSIFGVSEDRRAELSVFQKDVLLGARIMFNDVMGSELTLTAISDIERDNERLYNLSFARRLSDSWKANTGIRIYHAPQKGSIVTGLETLHKDNHLFFNLTRYF